MQSFLKSIRWSAAFAATVSAFNGGIEMWRAHDEADRLIHNGAVLHSIEVAVWVLVLLAATVLIEIEERTEKKRSPR